MLDICAIMILLIIMTFPVTVYMLDRMGFDRANDGKW